MIKNHVDNQQMFDFLLIFCKITARQLYLIGENFKLLKVKEDYSFDAEWWNMKYLQLLDNQLKLQEEEYER